MDRYIGVDEEGYFVFDGVRVEDPEAGHDLIKHIRRDDKNRFITSLHGQEAWLEAFDEPLIAKHVNYTGADVIDVDFTYGVTQQAKLSSLSIDEWDRFHGLTIEGIPFVFSRHAQVEFFDLLESFDDDSITVGGKRYMTPPWLIPNGEVSDEKHWSKIYREEKPGWELGREAAALPNILPQLKLSKSRVLVLGCGSGHDAAYFARQGHMVTAVDFSGEAIQRAKGLYSEIENLTLKQADVFNLPSAWTGQYDLIFEHTLYCAINAERRNELRSVWKRLLQPQGHLLGVFFVMDKRTGPCYGGSEWEIRERLKKDFNFIFWTRWRHSVEDRKGRELVLYASRK